MAANRELALNLASPPTRRQAHADRVISAKLKTLFRKESKRIADQVADEYARRSQASQTLAHHPGSAGKLAKAGPNDDADAIVDGIKFDAWVKTAKALTPQYRAVAQNAGQTALVSLAIDSQDIFDLVNVLAADWADARAAELVGMKLDPATGQWVTNPNPKWAITQTTREDIHDAVVDAFENGLTPDELRDRIVNDTAFGEYRAEMIARTEVNMAQSAGTHTGWERSGVVQGKEWLLGSEHDIVCVCDDNDEVIVALDEEFPSGDAMPPAHPFCVCAIAPVLYDHTRPANADGSTA
jgi:hypothetical protein